MPDQTITVAGDAVATTNLAVLRGSARGEPVLRVLPSGGTVLQFDLATTIVGEPTDLSCSSSAPTTESSYCTMTPPDSRSRTWTSGGTLVSRTPAGVGPAMWGPLVGGSVWYWTVPSLRA